MVSSGKSLIICQNPKILTAHVMYLFICTRVQLNAQLANDTSHLTYYQYD